MIDIFHLDTSDPSAVQRLVTVLQRHLSVDERQHLLDDLDAWERKIPADARRVMTAFALMLESGEVCPFTVGAYEMLTEDLRTSEQWLEVLSWRNYIFEITAETRRAA